jgi:hypothetical protein
VAGLAFSGAANAARVGVFIGGPIYPYYAPGPYYYAPPPPVIVAPAPQPDTYVEQGQAPEQGPAQAPTPDAQQGAPGSWYYCDASRTYYPYVKECAGGWREVPATPPAPGQ